MTVFLIGLHDDLAERLVGALPEAVVVRDARSPLPPVLGPREHEHIVVQDVRLDGDAAASIERSTYGVWEVYELLQPAVHVVLSTLRMFDAYDANWGVTEAWHPRPTTDPYELVPYLGELTVRELARVRPVAASVYRLESDRAGTTGEEFDRIVGLIGERATETRRGLRVEHAARFTGFAAPAPAVMPAPPARPRDLARPERVVLFGAGGPLGAAVTTAAAGEFPLVLSDVTSLAVRAAAPAQTPGAPVPAPASWPNTEVVADVSDLRAVSELARGADCLINCTVVRDRPLPAFRVNVLGAYAVMRAAVDQGVPRVVHTGPAFVVAPHPYGYADDRGIEAPPPPRAGDDLYLLTKLLAMEICRIFAEEHGIACPALLFIQMTDPEIGREDQAHPFIVSWRDAGRAIVAAATVEELPEPFPVLHILVESPHGRFGAGDAWSTLAIAPRDRLDHLWYGDMTKTETTR